MATVVAVVAVNDGGDGDSRDGDVSFSWSVIVGTLAALQLMDNYSTTS